MAEIPSASGDQSQIQNSTAAAPTDSSSSENPLDSTTRVSEPQIENHIGSNERYGWECVQHPLPLLLHTILSSNSSPFYPDVGHYARNASGRAPPPTLPSEALSEEDLATDEMNEALMICSICMDGIVLGEEETLPCGHEYHHSCIWDWLIVSNTCPICRYELLMD